MRPGVRILTSYGGNPEDAMRRLPLTQSLTRRQLLALAGGTGLAALAGDAMFVEPQRLTTSRYAFRTQDLPERTVYRLCS